MSIYRNLTEVPVNFGPCSITIGNFDGVHIGHQHILDRVVRLAREQGLRSAALTFDPHPTKLVAPSRAPRLLTTPEQRARLMLAEGIDEVLILPFTRDIAKFTPDEFVRTILVEKLRARVVLVGDNFRFGHQAVGDARTLVELGARYGFETAVAQAVTIRGRVVSSSEVRRAIEAGQVSLACRMLSRPYSLEGRVVQGEGIGRKQTVPTLNLDTSAEVLPRVGVYITRTRDRASGREWPSITNVGYRPTFNGHGLTVETFLLSDLGATEPREIAVEFLRWVREERKFESPEVLKAQILRDVGRAQTYFRRRNAGARLVKQA